MVVLWTDTFNDHFHPETLVAALHVLRGAGFEVAMPPSGLCCGRPLYDFGFLSQAKAYLERIMTALSGPLEGEVPIVVLEPSCASVFRDELRNLFPNDPRANRLRRQTFLLSEFLEHHAPAFVPPRLDHRVLFHGHCHHKALMKTTDELSLLRRMGATVEAPDTGCCGMAGPFGLLEHSHAVSRAIGEQVLLPAVRRTEADALIVSDGFSCREQIRQATGRRAIHLAEAIEMGARRPKT